MRDRDQLSKAKSIVVLKKHLIYFELLFFTCKEYK